MLESFDKVAKHRSFSVNFTDHLWWLLLKILEMSFFQQMFPLQLKLHLQLIYFHSYSFATSMVKMSSNIFFSNVSLKAISYRKKYIKRKLPWNSEKPSSRTGVFFNSKRCSWKFLKIHTPLPEPRFLLRLLT